MSNRISKKTARTIHQDRRCDLTPSPSARTPSPSIGTPHTSVGASTPPSCVSITRAGLGSRCLTRSNNKNTTTTNNNNNNTRSLTESEAAERPIDDVDVLDQTAGSHVQPAHMHGRLCEMNISEERAAESECACVHVRAYRNAGRPFHKRIGGDDLKEIRPCTWKGIASCKRSHERGRRERYIPQRTLP